MIDQEKSIKALDCCLDIVRSGRWASGCIACPYAVEENSCREKMILDVIALLKEQDAVEPKLDIDAFVCGNCGHGLIHQELLGEAVLFEERYNYCPQCGRAVKWE